MRGRDRWVHIITLCAALFAAWATTQTKHNLMPTIVQQTPDDYETEWVSGGLTHRVKTRLADHDGDLAAAAAAHKAKVDALLEVFPKDA